MTESVRSMAAQTGVGPARTYESFDSALAENFFTNEQAGLPVYLDMDDESFRAAAASLQLAPEAFTEGMIESVRSLLYLGDTGYRVFHPFDFRLGRWRIKLRAAQRAGADLPPPPIVALLATFTAAAETMGDSKSTHIHDSAYYPRLLNLLKVPEQHASRFKESFRQSTEAYWDALRIWLEAIDGNRGLPSAYALNLRYVGLPISQALIRETERRQLKNMFSDMALPAGMGISQTDMETSLGQWISTTPSPASASLRQLWANADSRSRIVEIAIVEFEAWDGYGREASSGHSRSFVGRAPRCSLAISERRALFGSTVDVAFVVPASAVTSGRVTLATSEGPVELAVAGIGNALCGASATSAHLDPQSILSGVLTIVADRDVTFQRYPRNVVPLVRDAFANAYIETERILVGDPSVILVRDEGDLPAQVSRILEEVARPGYRMRDAAAGAPIGWILFSDVQVLKAPSVQLVSNQQLDALVPRLSTQMTLTGGLRLPGRIARWSALSRCPPRNEIRRDHKASVLVDVALVMQVVLPVRPSLMLNRSDRLQRVCRFP
jgi:hypothetical protein